MPPLRRYGERCATKLSRASPGTRAAEMPNPVPAQIAQARHQRLSDLAAEMTLSFHQSFIGKTVDVLVEGAVVVVFLVVVVVFVLVVLAGALALLLT